MSEEQRIDQEADTARAAADKMLFEAKAYLFTILNKKPKLTENEVEIFYHLRKDEQLAPKLVYEKE